MPVQVRGTFQNREREKYHPTLRKKVLATADVAIQQVQLVDSKGQIRAVVVWKCGTDVLYATTMDGLFDDARRRTAPPWMVDQLESVEEAYDASGHKKVPFTTKNHVPNEATEDLDTDDIPVFAQG